MFDPESMVPFVQISFEVVNSCHGTPHCTCIIEWKCAYDYKPAGRLPVTFYISETQLPDFEDYSMQGLTYRFFTDELLFSLGHGLSYSQFECAAFFNKVLIIPDVL